MLTDAQVIELNPTLKAFQVTLKEAPREGFPIQFLCFAEDADHAQEQADDAYSGCEILTAFQRK